MLAPSQLRLFGRADALSVIAGVIGDSGSAVAVGEPGMGKSSLLRVAHELAEQQGRLVLAVSPTQFEQGLPFAGLADLTSQFPEDVDAALPDPQKHALAVAVRRAEPGASEVDSLAVPLAIRGLLSQLCTTRSVAIVIDDLQWLDQASVGSLCFALRRLSVDPRRMCVLVGTRPEGASSELIRCLPDPRHELQLAPLVGHDVGQLLRTRYGPRWTPPISERVAYASGGNPFLALMIAKSMQAGTPDWALSGLPSLDAVVPVPVSLTEYLSLNPPICCVAEFRSRVGSSSVWL